MSEDTVVVPGSTVTPEWLRKKANVFGVLEEQVIRELEFPGTGLTLEALQLFAEQPREMLSPNQRLINACYRKLRRRLDWIGSVDPLPKAATAENLAKWEKFNLRLVFLPDGGITESIKLRNYVKPEKWFYDQIRAGTIDADSAKLKRGWYVADFTVGADYTNGTQSYPNDSLGPLISKLRHAGVIGKYDKTPWESRFAITNDEWRDKLLPSLTDELSATGVTFRLEGAIEFNAIGNIYDSNRAKFNCWEWFDDVFRGGDRLYGGGRGSGGLADVDGYAADGRGGGIAGRPLGCFV